MTNKKVKKQYSTSLVLLAAVLFGHLWLGCGASVERTSALPPPAPPIDESLLDLIPDRMNAVLWIDMEKFRSSALFEAFEILVGDETIPFLKETGPVDPVRNAKELLLAFASSARSETDQFLALFKGTYDKTAIIDSFSGDDEVVSQEIGAFPSIRTPKFIVTFLTDRTLAIGTFTAVKQVTDLARQKGKSLKDNPDFSDYSLDGSTAARIRYRPGITTPDLTQYGTGVPPIRIDSIRGLDGSATINNGLEIKISIDAETQMDAAGIASELENTRRKLARNMFIIFLGIDWILDRIDITPKQASLLISAKLDGRDIEEIKRLATRLRKIRELADEEDTQGSKKGPFRFPPIETLPKQEPK